MKKSMIWRFIGLAVMVGIGLGADYLFCPASNIRSVGLWLFVIIIVVIGGVIQFIIDWNSDDYKVNFLGLKVFGGITGVLVVAMVIAGLTGAQLFNASKYQQLVAIEEGNFEEDINRIENTNNISIVDMETAESVGDRTVGSIKNSTWYEVDDEYNLIEYQGEQYRISPLNYGGYFKYLKAKQVGIPGYVLVNTQTQEATYVELTKGMQYSPSAFLSHDLKRHLRSQYSNYIFGTPFFEIDENGNPYYITAVKQPTIGLFGGQKEESFIVTDAITGESTEYSTADLPEWIDHAYDLDYLMGVARYNLTYVNGFWNSLFAKTDVLKLTYEYTLARDTDSDGNTDAYYASYNTTITSDGDIVFYTGLTPASNAESNVGFILANPKTGVIKRYECAGAEESSAMSSAESLVQDLKYVATFPTILNVDGNETYFMLLKDKAGLVQRYALCNVKNYTQVVQADTLNGALQAYREKLGTSTTESETVETETLNTEGIIENLYQAQLDGCTYYYFTIEGSTDLYMSSIKNSNKQVMLKVGTKVSIEYKQSSEDGVYIVQKIQF